VRLTLPLGRRGLETRTEAIIWHTKKAQMMVANQEDFEGFDKCNRYARTTEF
jgi:hypothetical protein